MSQFDFGDQNVYVQSREYNNKNCVPTIFTTGE